MNKRKYILAFIVVFVTFLVWYLFIKKSDYTITFKAKAATGVVFQGIQEWTTVQAKENKEIYTVIQKTNFDNLQHKMTNGGENYQYNWQITPLNDTVTQVKVDIKQEGSSIYNRLTAPFFNTAFKQAQIEKIKNFKEGLNQHLKAFKAKVDGVGTSEETFVAYINLKSVQQEKAQTMIASDAIITGFLFRNNIKITGKPYLEVLDWDIQTEKLNFNYCFPIDKNTKIIQDSLVKFKTIPALKGIKATYNGNYRTSDRAWYLILDYAKKHNHALEYKPLEHFLANPFNGGDELTWETKIIIPFSKK